MVTGDASYIKKINRSIIISKIIEHGMISRADLAKITGLNKATISVQVSEMLKEELIFETQLEHKNLGRRPIMLSINENAGYALGIDLDQETISFNLSNLLGKEVSSKCISINTSDYEEIEALLLEHIMSFQDQCAHSSYGLVGVVIGIHGIVNKDEKIFFVPHHQWRNVDLKKGLEEKTGIPIYIENNANLCSFAEKVFKHHQSDNLLSVTLYSGIGLGIIVNGETLKGHHGYAGEIGHMIIMPDGIRCKCGNAGCWEQYASEASFMKQLCKTAQSEVLTYEEIANLIDKADSQIMNDLDKYINYLAIGVNNIINLYNPETLIINSELLQLFPETEEKIKTKLHSSVGHFSRLLISDFGNKACIMGACALAIQNFFCISDLCLTVE
ncbi:ROK family protein [Sutcliffiella cohnii]|uniref:ROK family protein n=1 Tax=Sutcliffiella cohnii TaxID=33932 RepID=A0A223KKH6_9BACI|nr:ROK family protein [Sutcliffiella cohnii]AST89990.1 ROK family protein [Sutcliffiella cohnii]